MSEDPIAAAARAAVPDYGTFGPDPHGWLEDDFELAPGHPPFAPARGFAHGQQCRRARALDVERLTRVLRTLWLTPGYIDADASENGYRTVAEAIVSEYERLSVKP